MNQTCLACGAIVSRHRSPTPTVDIIIHDERGRIVLIERRHEPHGWALPGGFVDYGETLEAAAIREAFEETGLELLDLRQFRAYSDPRRDPRQHNISIVFTARARGQLRAGDDAQTARWFPHGTLPSPLCFDHGEILEDYWEAVEVLNGPANR